MAETSAETIFEARGLSVDIPVAGGTLHAVQEVDLRVARGETLAVVGESGSGKSLTSLALMGLLPSSATRRADTLELHGEDLLAASERRMSDLRGNAMSMIFQEPMTSLNPSYTIGDQLTEPLRRHRRVSRAAARARAAEMLAKVGIPGAESRLAQYPHQLSGGLRQRVMIAMALICDPDLVIADEPTTALDVTIQAQILRLLASLTKEAGAGLLLITHDLGVVARTADRVAVMYAGQVVETGPAAAIFRQPTHPYTQGLLRCIPVPGQTPPGHRLGAIPGVVPALVGRLPGCHFADRCALATAACREAPVSLRPAGDDHLYRCRLSPEDAILPTPESAA